MSKPKFEEGTWVKEKTGTKGMTVVSNVVDRSSSEYAGNVLCKFKNAEGEEVEETFKEEDLVPLD